MAPFFSGMAIGIAILIPLVILIFAIRFLLLIGAFFYGFAASVVLTVEISSSCRRDHFTMRARA